MSEPFDKLAAKLSELFELEKADLDFGIHRIIKARQQHIRIFLGLDEAPADDPGAPTLKKIVLREMGELNTADLERRLAAAAEKITTNYGKLAFTESGTLTDGPASTSPDGQQWFALREQLDAGEEIANAQLEAEIYSHLTEFFSRYYDEADFLSKRRIKAGDAPYAVPYGGEEVMLHWANKDQYYIKSSKDLKDYTFTLPERFGANKRVQFKCQRQDPVLNNNNAKREFHLDDEAELEITADSLVIPFHFKIVEKTRTKPEINGWIETILAKLPIEWQQALKHTPEGAANNLITRHLANYTRKNEADFFIHKHLGTFLRGELDFYIKNEVMHLDDIDAKSADYLAARVRLIKALRNIARHIITFLAQLENFQKKLWLKKKTVTETQYCITLDRIFAMENGDALIATALPHLDTKIRRYDGEMRSQIDEWIKLYAIDEVPGFPKNRKLTAAFLKTHDKLMLDTVFFPASFKWQLLGGIDDLDGFLNGLIIHSENFQALNLLQERYRGRVKCVYIDPPYNTEKDRNEGKFIYKDCFARSSWNSFIVQTLVHCHELIRDDGTFFSSIDHNEVAAIKMILNIVFYDSNFEGLISWRRRHNQPNDKTKMIGMVSEYILSYSKNSDSYKKSGVGKLDLTGEFSNTDNDPLGDWASKPWKVGSDQSGSFYEITTPSGRVLKEEWMGEEATYKKLLADNRIYFPKNGDGSPRKKYYKFEREDEGQCATNWWNHEQFGHNQGANDLMTCLMGAKNTFSNPKPIELIRGVLQISKSLNSICLDYFAGSGTTAHAVINLNREDGGTRSYILVEMGDHFDTVLKPRIQKVVYSKDWKEGKPVAKAGGKKEVDWSEQLPMVAEGAALPMDEGAGSTFYGGISHAFKYLRLESYEDALNNLDLGRDRTPDLLGHGSEVREGYLLSYLLDVETREHLMNLDRFGDPWACQLKIHDPHTGKSEARAIDLVETFSYLLGLTVQRVRVQGEKGGFLTLEGQSPEGEAVLVIWRKTEGPSDWPATTNAALKAWAAKALDLKAANGKFHAIYVNGDHTLEDPHGKVHCIEEVFYERMFENTGNPDD